MGKENAAQFSAGLELLGMFDLSACVEDAMFMRFTPNVRGNAAHFSVWVEMLGMVVLAACAGTVIVLQGSPLASGENAAQISVGLKLLGLLELAACALGVILTRFPSKGKGHANQFPWA